jgi:AcrR family transcriptional regulator
LFPRRFFATIPFDTNRPPPHNAVVGAPRSEAANSSGPLSDSRRKLPKKKSTTRDPERTRKTLLNAAIREFTEKGYGGARIDRIAERAGLNKRLLYHYFGDKDALYLAVLESTYVDIRTAEQGLNLENDEPIEAIRKLVQFTWDHFLAHPEFLSLLATENLLRAKHLKKSKVIFGLHSPLISLISAIIKRGTAAGQFRKRLDPVALYITIASLGWFYLSNRWTLSTIFQRDVMDKRELKKWRDHITDVVVTYVKA